ncbi:primase-helicase family protein [Flavobacterium sp. PLA-1-15]|uniref:primase-helicase family protein n=1 Tax=Flavobacterium sp. PLA-1-15 TaxID=3380533 RepID=UPI003B7C4651
MSYVKDTDIFDATNGGLDIILDYYPNARNVLEKSAKQFKIRESEKTASASIKQLKDGIWVVTDFGGDQVSRNGIQVCMLEEGLDYGKACTFLGAKYKIKGAKFQVHMPIIEKRPLENDEEKGKYKFEYFKVFTHDQLKMLGPRINEVHCTEYKLKNCKSFTFFKENEAVTTIATEDYPIFVFDFGDWQKIYQPMSYEKQYRFRYAGDKPKHHVWGLDIIQKEFKKIKKKQEEDGYDDYEEDDEEDGKKSKRKKTDPRLERVFMVSGGSDGLNLRSFGYYGVWFNSESEHLTWDDYKELKKCAKEIIYIADLDSTGVKQALSVGLKYLDIKMLWLPEKLKEYRDKRGNPRKDFKDYVEVFNKEDNMSFINGFKKLVANALPLQFWTEYTNAQGKLNYNLSNTRLYHFLSMLGFGRYESETEKEGYIFIKKEGSIIRILEPYQIENFVHSFLEERGMSPDLRDYIYKSPQLGERSLSKLPSVKIDFQSADRNSQYLFFTKKVWKITGNEIIEYKQGDVEKYVWEDKIIDFDIKKEEPHFTISKDSDGDFDIEIHRKDNMFFNYLINTSRVHWKKELEDHFEGRPPKEEEEYFKANKFKIDGENLSADEILEQKLHLINKMFSIGYALHKYKNYNKPWAIFAMDNKVSDLGESHGGSGKSLGYGFLNKILKRRVYLKGRDPKLTTNDFIYHEVSEDTDYILIDDATQHLNFDFFFSEITGSLKVNPKNGSPFEIPFEKSPKFIFTSNFALRNVDPSTARRLLITVFSDYYHGLNEEEYKQVRKVSDDFDGQNLFTDFGWDQYNHYYNFCAQCLQFYLSTEEKINPPMDNVTKRTLQAEMGEAFIGWADAFFLQRDVFGEYLYLDKDFSKEDAFDLFQKDAKVTKWTTTKFKKCIKAYCKWNGWVMNPKDMLNSANRIIKTINNKSQEVIYIDTQKSQQTGLVEKIIQEEVKEDDGLTVFDRD